MNQSILLVDYNPDWPMLFQQVQEPVAAVLGELAVTIDHVGSTSIPGCPAKPIIDLDVVIASPSDLPATIARLATLGYLHEGDLGIADREAFVPPAHIPYHHLYVCTVQSEEYQRHILFRDYLRSHSQEVQAYAALKHELAQRFPLNRDGYSKGKSEFVARILQRARQGI